MSSSSEELLKKSLGFLVWQIRTFNYSGVENKDWCSLATQIMLLCILDFFSNMWSDVLLLVIYIYIYIVILFIVFFELDAMGLRFLPLYIMYKIVLYGHSLSFLSSPLCNIT